MAQAFTRQQLYDLVWSTPVKTLAGQFGISDVGLRKTCQKAHIPLPQLGHWAKVAAGKKVIQQRLPIRPPGLSDTVVPGAGRYPEFGYRLSDEELLGPLPEPPTFDESIEAVRERCLKLVGTVKVARDLVIAHAQIRKLLAEDELRREQVRGRSYVSSWDAPRFDTPFEQRRLRILNAIMLAAARAGAKPQVGGRRARSISVAVHGRYISLELDSEEDLKREHDMYGAPKTAAGATMKLIIGHRPGAIDRSWGDTPAARLEAQLSEIVAEIFVEAELRYRRELENRHQWRIESKERRLREIQLAIEKAEQEERQRREQLRQERIERLLGEAADFRRASDIRDYVAAVAAAAPEVDAAALDHWRKWALSVADDVDPVSSGRFLADI